MPFYIVQGGRGGSQNPRTPVKAGQTIRGPHGLRVRPRVRAGQPQLDLWFTRSKKKNKSGRRKKKKAKANPKRKRPSQLARALLERIAGTVAKHTSAKKRSASRGADKKRGRSANSTKRTGRPRTGRKKGRKSKRRR